MTTDLHLLPTQLVFTGCGAVARLGSQLNEYGARRAVIVTSRSLASAAGFLDELLAALQPLAAVDVIHAKAHAPQTDVFRVRDRLSERHADAVICIGGGSVSDVTKAALSQLLDSGLPMPHHAAIPTTLSGSEFAHYFGVTEQAGDELKKISYQRKEVVARAVALDPTATRHTPDRLWVSSAMKSLDHAIEGLIGSPTVPILSGVLQRGIRRMVTNLAASRNRDDLEARTACQTAAWENYFAPATMVLGLSHRIGHILGGTYGVPHGLTTPITLPHICRIATNAAPDALGLVARALNPDIELDTEASATSAPTEVAERLAALCNDFDLPRTLRDVGVPKSAAPSIVTQIVDSHSAVLAAVGVTGTRQELIGKLTALIMKMY